MFRPWVRKNTSSHSPIVRLQASNTVAISSTLQRLDGLVVDIDDDVDAKYYCIECDGSLTLEDHFRYVFVNVVMP